ncbi:MAG: hypothetical protein ACR2LK_04245 [Solirubrobacteraceae bacterium]
MSEVAIESCPLCGALTQRADVDLHARWHEEDAASARVLEPVAGWNEPISSHAERAGQEIAQEVPDDLPEEWLALDDAPNDPEPPPEPIARHPQIPEHGWATLNHEQKHDVTDRIERIAKLNTVLANPDAHRIDKEVAESSLTIALGALHDDYAFELLPAEVIEQADAAFATEPPPARVGPQSPPVAGTELERRRRYLLAKHGLSPEAEEDRRDEIAEIERRLVRAR